MPKEIVRSCETVPALPDPQGGEIPPHEGLVQVGWSGEAEHVSVATFSRHPETYETVFEGYHTALDRRGINDLIRYLRRARDQAFGRDE